VRESGWLPVDETPDGIVLVTRDPEMLRSSHSAAQIYPGKKLLLRVTTRHDFQKTLEAFFYLGEGGQIDTLLSNMGTPEGLEDEEHKLSADEISAAQDN